MNTKPEKRICVGCNKEKDPSEFNPHGGSLRCKACQQEAILETRRKGGRALSAAPEAVLEAARAKPKSKAGRPRKHTPTLLLVDPVAKMVRFFAVTEVWSAPLDGDLKASIAAAPVPLVADYAAQRVQPGRKRRKVRRG